MPTLPRPDQPPVAELVPGAPTSSSEPPPVERIGETFAWESVPSRRWIWAGTGVAAIAAFAAGFLAQRRMPHPQDAAPSVVSQGVLPSEETPPTAVPEPIAPPEVSTAPTSALEVEPAVAPASSATEATPPLLHHRKMPSERLPMEHKPYMPRKL